jgi:hypothetical protein
VNTIDGQSGHGLMSPALARRNSHPGALITQLLRAGLAASPGAIRQERVAIPEDVDWTHLCAVAFRCRIAPVLYQCVRRTSAAIPADVMDWFRVQHYETVARNMALSHDLHEVVGWFTEGALPTILLKGAALADLGLGAARVSADLDLLVHQSDLRRADAILRSHGYRALADPPHDYHIRYGLPTPSGTRVVEIHYDIFDRPRYYRPDTGGLWDRSREATLANTAVRVPDLMDHILLTIMQLPHHHWAVRLVVDLWQIALRWQAQIDWPALFERAKDWQMSVLTRSALHALWAMFDVPTPPAVVARAHPSGYLERMQWRAAKSAIVEQLEHPFRPRVILLVPFLLVDQVKRVPGMLLRRSLGSGGSPDESPVSKATRRNAAGVAALPAIGKVLLASIGQSTVRPGWPR